MSRREVNAEVSLAGIKLALQEVRVGDESFELWMPAVADDVLEASISNAQANPYWATVWPAATRMAQFVLRHLASNVSLLELGCGPGLVGLAALSRGVSVTFNDVVPEAAQLSLRNAHHNGFFKCSTSVFDWKSPPPESVFDHIIASDVLYETEAHAPLLQTLGQLLPHHGEAWIGDMGRIHALEFIGGLRQRGWNVTTVDEQGRETEPATGSFQVFRLTRI